MLNLYKLEIFNSVAIEGSFSRAASRLLLSQPAVSQHIRELEGSLGAELFRRGNRGVTLTPAGEILLDYTRCILRMLAEAESAIGDLDPMMAGPVAIGATPGVGVYLLPGWIQSYRRRYEGIAITLRTDTTPEIASEVLAGRVDFGFVEGEITPKAPLSVLALQEIELRVVVGMSHAWWERRDIQMPELGSQDFIARPPGSHTRAWTELLFSQHHITPRIVAEFDNPEAIKQAVAAGMGIAILPEWNLKDGSTSVRAIPIRGLELRRTLKLLWSAEQAIKPGTRAFLALLTDQYPVLAQFAPAVHPANLHLPGRDEYRASLDCRTER